MRIVWSVPVFAAFLLQPVNAQVAQQENHTYDELGRLTSTTNTGSSLNGETRSICYDEAGNRTDFDVRTNGATTTCPAPGSQTPPAGPPEPSDPPVPDPPENYPPVTQDDIALGCDFDYTLVLWNDSAPEQGESLTLISITFDSGDTTASATITSSPLGDVQVVYPSTAGQSAFFTYTVRDGFGLESTGQLRVQAEEDCFPN